MELVTWLLLLCIIIVVFGTMAYASFRAAPWLPLRKKDHKRVLDHLNKTEGLFVDLGAGDARMLVDVCRHTKLHCIGYEISVLPYLAGKLRLFLQNTSSQAEMKFKDFFREDLSHVDIVYCFLTPPAMKKLKKKFEQELRPGTRVISYSFEISGWTPTHVDRNGTGIPVFVYDR